MKMLGRFLCWLGWHDMQRIPPPMSPEVASRSLTEAKGGLQALGAFLALAYIASRERCSRCGKENR